MGGQPRSAGVCIFAAPALAKRKEGPLSAPVDQNKQAATQELLEQVREAARLEQQVKVEAPIEAKRIAEEQIRSATANKLRAMVAARAGGATLSAIAAQLGTRNLTHVSKLLKNAEHIQ